MGGSHSTLTNCSFDENEAVVGGGIYNNWSSPTVTNCVLWNDLPDEINNTNGSSPVVTYSDIQFFSGTYPGTGNINAIRYLLSQHRMTSIFSKAHPA